MKATLQPLVEAAMAAARNALPEIVTVGAATLLPRGADPFIGSERPLLLSATRWAAISPGGVLIGASPPAIAAVFGFDLPERPVPVPAEARTEGAAPPEKWSDLVTAAARAPLTTFSHAVANALSPLASLPPDLAATQITLNDTEAQIRGEIGPVPDAIVLMLHADALDVRLVIVVPGVFAARLRRGEPQNQVVLAAGETLARPAGESSGMSAPQLMSSPLDAALARVPLDLSIEVGVARIPLSRVLHLRDGDVIELREAVDAPVKLVSDSTPVARGDLEVAANGNLVLLVTSIPGRSNPAAPRLVVEAEADGLEAGASADAGDEPADGAPASLDAPAESADAPPAAADAPADVPPPPDLGEATDESARPSPESSDDA
jgi:flagellar motor switch protein FliN/FliY